MKNLFGYIAIKINDDPNSKARLFKVGVVENFNFRGYDLFVHTNHKGFWIVTEKRSGAKVCTDTRVKDFKGHLTKSDAIKQAKDNIGNSIHEGTFEKLVLSFSARIEEAKLDFINLKILNLV